MLEAAELPVNPELAVQDNALRVLEKAYGECESRLGRPATNLEVCNELGMSLRELYSLLDLHRGVGLGRVDDFASESGEELEPLIKYYPDPTDEECFHVYPKSGFGITMARALEALPKNERLVVSLYHNDNLTMQEIAQIFGISETRVAQIHTTAMLRIRGKLHSLDGN